MDLEELMTVILSLELAVIIELVNNTLLSYVTIMISICGVVEER